MAIWPFILLLEHRPRSSDTSALLCRPSWGGALSVAPRPSVRLSRASDFL